MAAWVAARPVPSTHAYMQHVWSLVLKRYCISVDFDAAYRLCCHSSSKKNGFNKDNVSCFAFLSQFTTYHVYYSLTHFSNYFENMKHLKVLRSKESLFSKREAQGAINQARSSKIEANSLAQLLSKALCLYTCENNQKVIIKIKLH